MASDWLVISQGARDIQGASGEDPASAIKLWSDTLATLIDSPVSWIHRWAGLRSAAGKVDCAPGAGVPHDLAMPRRRLIGPVKARDQAVDLSQPGCLAGAPPAPPLARGGQSGPEAGTGLA
jgi:hypothetical protein